MRLAVVGTFYRRWERNPAIIAALANQSRPADEHWIVCEDSADWLQFTTALGGRTLSGLRVLEYPTPRVDGEYAVIPYSHKINWVLDQTTADAIVYLDNGSLPALGKYGAMLAALEAHPAWGAVYCGQHRTGVVDAPYPASEVVEDAYCVLNYTQVMHRRTADRWTLDMAYAKPDLADALFWRALHASLGPFYPVPGILDEHHIESELAVGV